MKTEDILRLGVPAGNAVQLAHSHMRHLFAQGLDRTQVETDLMQIVADPPAYFADEVRAPLARAIYRPTGATARVPRAA